MRSNPQRFRRTVVSRAIIMAMCGTATMLVAQETLAQQASSSLQRVEVTGSNIRRTDSETAAPVQVISREEIQQSGKANVGEYLQTLAVDNTGSVPTSFGRGFSGGVAAGISLRGLGANSTLVLVNGRRITPHAVADDSQKAFADLNLIPLEAVERVEILKDGASAIYGSDAIAGVVNFILRKNYVGTVAKVSYGTSRYGDGNTPQASITHGFGDVEKDGYNVLLNLEVGKKDAIHYTDRIGRGTVGQSALYAYGYPVDPNGGGVGNGALAGGGTIPVNPATGALVNNSANANSIVGSVRNPSTLNYYARSNPAGVGFGRTFPGATAFCNATSNLAQNDPGKGCVADVNALVQGITPDQKSANFYGRFTKPLNAQTELYAELNLYQNKSHFDSIMNSVSGTILYPGGVISSSTVALGPDHPDNPYPGQTARLRYAPLADIGPRTFDSTEDVFRLATGVKGTFAEWDYDTAFLVSESRVKDTANGSLVRAVEYALLNPTAANVAAAKAISPAYAALPAGTYWRIGENAGLNSPALLAALSPAQTRDALSRQTSLDFKASREFGRLEGGPIGVAAGAEIRRETLRLNPYSGTGSVIGLPYSVYDASRTVYGVYTEALFPVTKKLELNAAVRYDRYSDAGSVVTPKVGAKFAALPTLAFRGTYAQGFRAPSAPENGATAGFAAGAATIVDTLRCAAGVPGQCTPTAATLLQAGNPNLQPEKSQNYSLGMVWDLTPSTSTTLDVWQIKRKNQVVTEDLQAAADAGSVVRDPATSTGAGDPGAILAVLARYVNAARTEVKGIDWDVKHRMSLGSNGKLTFGANWTHLLGWKRVDQDGTVHEYAGYHGDCNTTNCMGTVKDRINLNVTWDMGPWRVGAVANYRGSIKNREEKGADCEVTTTSGGDLPAGCKIGSFTTVDLNWRWKWKENTEVFGTIQNLMDKKPPFDPTTYGAIGFNPLDVSGAIGRFYTVGLRHKF